ncbi:class I SAM-dependent methyltransferase [Nocardia sp. CA2R105]|uniref:mycofactocin oligosaccharide methyltransferase MftM n=1 Tax=Nocardia coffeae TaxID=2873381 RepID=UPI001CA65AE8|nr:mycofactocin oligosaccharide methyltransferase MftM [Nocardia coffeae]MBY8862406.1 class I SAM-dependent methyltransferase [Nocardia coffeae]
MRGPVAPPPDPLAESPELPYDDGVVRVAALRPGHATSGVDTVHFRVHARAGRVVVHHRLPPERVDNDIAELIADELFRTGLVAGTDMFERILVGVVRSSVEGELPAWDVFYRNTLAKIRGHWAGTWESGTQLAGMAPVYRRAADLVVPGRALDIASCFGFFPMLLAETGRTVVASDLSRGGMRLLAAVAARRRVEVGTLTCDAAAVPLPPKSVPAVTVLHLLEHLDPEHARAVLAEAIRIAQRRVVVAVPLEDEPDPVYGHVRTFDLPELQVLGLETGLPHTVSEYHGGWLVLDID